MTRKLHVHIFGISSFAVEGLRHFLQSHPLNSCNVDYSTCFEVCEGKFEFKRCKSCLLLQVTENPRARDCGTHPALNILLMDDHGILAPSETKGESRHENELFQFLETLRGSNYGTLAQRQYSVRAILLTARSNPAYLKCLIDAGLNGLVHMRSPEEEVLRAIYAVTRGEFYIDPEIERLVSGYQRYLEVSGLKSLSGRELEVLLEISSGLKNQLIARKFFISVGTVERHKANIEAKLRLNADGLFDFARVNADAIRYLVESKYRKS